MKIEAAVTNARASLDVQEELESFDRYIWQFTEHRTIRSPHRRMRENLPSSTAESDAMSKELKKRGFRFVGSPVCYAHMQATGMVDDHVWGRRRNGGR